LIRQRFVRVLWSSLILYELFCLFLAGIIRDHSPSYLPPPLPGLLEGAFLLATLLPLYLVLSFRGFLPRRRSLNVLFFLFYFSAGVFLSGLLLSLALIGLHNLLFSESEITGPSRWTAGESTGGLLLLTLFGIALFERVRPPRVIRKTLCFPGLSPDLSGTTILHLSDLHVGAWQGEESLRRIAETARGLSADLVVYTGDMIDYRPEEARIFEKVFGSLQGRLGTFAVLGNHEYWTLGQRARDFLKSCGVPVLRNESRIIQRGEGRIRVVGVDDPAGEDEGPGCGPDIAQSLKDVQEGEFVLVLVHQPTLWEGELKDRADLTLSGHTHGGQIGGRRPFWNLARIFFRYDAGLFEAESPALHGHYLNVSTGLGYYGIPIRLGMAPEMTLITLCAPASLSQDTVYAGLPRPVIPVGEDRPLEPPSFQL